MVLAWEFFTPFFFYFPYKTHLTRIMGFFMLVSLHFGHVARLWLSTIVPVGE